MDFRRLLLGFVVVCVLAGTGCGEPRKEPPAQTFIDTPPPPDPAIAEPPSPEQALPFITRAHREEVSVPDWCSVLHRTASGSWICDQGVYRDGKLAGFAGYAGPVPPSLDVIEDVVWTISTPSAYAWFNGMDEYRLTRWEDQMRWGGLTPTSVWTYPADWNQATTVIAGTQKSVLVKMGADVVRFVEGPGGLTIAGRNELTQASEALLGEPRLLSRDGDTILLELDNLTCAFHLTEAQVPPARDEDCRPSEPGSLKGELGFWIVGSETLDWVPWSATEGFGARERLPLPPDPKLDAARGSTLPLLNGAFPMKRDTGWVWVRPQDGRPLEGATGAYAWRSGTRIFIW